jgi:hypothetical protein
MLINVAAVKPVAGMQSEGAQKMSSLIAKRQECPAMDIAYYEERQRCQGKYKAKSLCYWVVPRQGPSCLCLSYLNTLHPKKPFRCIDCAVPFLQAKHLSPQVNFAQAVMFAALLLLAFFWSLCVLASFT